MYDRENDRRFYLFDIGAENDATANPDWWGRHVPIWTTATNQGIIKAKEGAMWKQLALPNFLFQVLRHRCTCGAGVMLSLMEFCLTSASRMTFPSP